MEVDTAAPEVFDNSSGTAAAVNQDRTINSASNRLRWVRTSPSGRQELASLPARTAKSPKVPSILVTCTLNEYLISAEPLTSPVIPPPVNFTYAAAAPGLVNGVVQINFQVPSDGVSQFALTANSQTSGPFMIWVK